MTLAHRMAAGLAFCLPMLAKVGGGGAAFTMYATSTWFRLEIVAHDAEGHARVIAPTDLARRVGPTAVPFLAGSDHLRRTNDAGALRAHLADVARVACLEDFAASEVAIALVERAGAIDGPETITRATAACAR